MLRGPGLFWLAVLDMGEWSPLEEAVSSAGPQTEECSSVPDTMGPQYLPWTLFRRTVWHVIKKIGHVSASVI